MKALVSFLTLNFLPMSQDFGLLLLRIALGLGMMILHGWNKVQILFGWGTSKVHAPKLNELAAQVDVFHLKGHWSLAALTFAEVCCAGLLVIGFGTRVAALILSFAMGVAFFVKHQHSLSGENSGEMAALYLAGFLVLLVAGPGRFSFDGSSAGGGGKA
jgi:putative oxidoreductase